MSNTVWSVSEWSVFMQQRSMLRGGTGGECSGQEGTAPSVSYAFRASPQGIQAGGIQEWRESTRRGNVCGGNRLVTEGQSPPFTPEYNF